MKNVENFGFINIVILNNKLKEIVESYGVYFDKILVDVFCFGEGMFCKDLMVVKKWIFNYFEKYVNL